MEIALNYFKEIILRVLGLGKCTKQDKEFALDLFSHGFCTKYFSGEGICTKLSFMANKEIALVNLKYRFCTNNLDVILHYGNCTKPT